MEMARTMIAEADRPPTTGVGRALAGAGLPESYRPVPANWFRRSSFRF
jgi:hypothetical protein